MSLDLFVPHPHVATLSKPPLSAFYYLKKEVEVSHSSVLIYRKRSFGGASRGWEGGSADKALTCKYKDPSSIPMFLAPLLT